MRFARIEDDGRYSADEEKGADLCLVDGETCEREQTKSAYSPDPRYIWFDKQILKKRKFCSLKNFRFYVRMNYS